MTKFEELKKSNNPTERRQLTIMAQSCQHDASKLIGDRLDSKDYRSVDELVLDICELRDKLLEDLVNKYY